MYADHARALLGYAARRCDEPSDVADVVADTMLVAWRRIDDVPPEPETRLWLFGVARNVINNSRRRRRRQARLGERLRSQFIETASQIEPIDTDLARAIRTALGRLKPVEREIILLATGEHLAPAEIATVLDLNPSTVRTHLQRARAKIRLELAIDGTAVDETRGRNGRGGHERHEARPMPRSHGSEEASA